MRAQSGCCDIQKHPFRPQHSCLSLYSPSAFLHLFLRLPSSPSIWTLPAPTGRVESQRHDSAPNPHSAFPILIPIPIPSLVSWSQSSLPPSLLPKARNKKSFYSAFSPFLTIAKSPHRSPPTASVNYSSPARNSQDKPRDTAPGATYQRRASNNKYRHRDLEP
jgi:hypothetical protein